MLNRHRITTRDPAKQFATPIVTAYKPLSSKQLERATKLKQKLDACKAELARLLGGTPNEAS
jgi:hypothetical protein